MLNKKKFILFLIIIIFIFINQAVFATNNHEIINSETNKSINDFKNEINKIANICIVFSLVSSVLILIIHFIRLSLTFNNSILRYKVLENIGISLVCTSLMGAVGLIFKIYVGIYM